jgi:hypothetical protein
VRRLNILALAALLTRCGAAPAEPDHQAEWRDVLRHKGAAVAQQATPRQRQIYADSLSAFVSKHPGHNRAREVYERIQLEFAQELASFGRYQDAIRFFRAVLKSDPRNDGARRGLAAAIDGLAVTHERLLEIEIGMSQRDVARLLGKPIPGWSATNERPSTRIEAWYYRTTDGGLAAIYFRDGQVFAAEEKSQARVGL